MDYIKELKKNFDRINAELGDCETADALGEIFKESMDYYCNTLIPDFFSSRGEGRKIRDMYRNLETYKYAPFVQESTVDTVDLHISNTAYQDYLNGMRTYITETCSYCVDADLYAKESAACEQKLMTARKNDSLFIESIFGGSNNEWHKETILEATKDIEALIDFMDTVKQESANCGVIIDQIKKGIADHDGSEELLLESAKMMAESFNNYVYHTISNVFTSYKNINDVLENKGSSKEPVSRYTVW